MRFPQPPAPPSLNPDGPWPNNIFKRIFGHPGTAPPGGVRHGSPGSPPNTPPAVTPPMGPHPTDATSGGSQGYGGGIDANALAALVAGLPSVASAHNNLLTQGFQNADQLRQSLQTAAINFGTDPNGDDLLSKLMGGNPQLTNLMKQYGIAFDPTVNQQAKAFTSDGQGHWGNSTIGQLEQQAQQALAGKLAAIGGSGFQWSGGFGDETNLSNIKLGQDITNAAQKVMDQLTGNINAATNTDTDLTDKYSNAILQGNQYVANHPGQFPTSQFNFTVGDPNAAPVGGATGANGQTNSYGWKPSHPGIGAFPTRTGGGSPAAPSLPKYPYGPPQQAPNPVAAPTLPKAPSIRTPMQTGGSLSG